MDPTKKELYTAKRSSGLDTSSDTKVRESILDLKSDSATNWILFKIAGSNSLQYFASGVGGFVELRNALSDEDIYYGVIRLKVVEMIKFYNISYVGENVGGMKKGKASMYKSAVFSITEAHGELSSPSELAAFTEDHIFSEVSRLSGTPKTAITFEI